jgi:predicted DCC family thiol-disulfide oxidoreductase YuxK
MSYVTFDYKCPLCLKKEERMVKRADMDVQYCCGVPLIRLHPAPKTTFRYADKKAFK